MKAITQTTTRIILDSYDNEDISYSRMNELFNELSDDWAIGFAKWCVITQAFGLYGYEKALEIYKQEIL